ncbi:hypothetical protein Cni_G09838 [Canna indica]|uniref:Uncharacterized protein n=1 Tax=Canna indica TaxID=4628 RepID=A0AAQ3Q825_9LILI|nr:hypothetical protein Cni_G09838 [Canna indica]
MADVDRRVPSGLIPAPYAAGLRRLSARAAPAPSPRSGLASFSPLADAVLAHLRAAGVPLLPGLSPDELAHAEAELAFAFPPDLRALLSLALPSAPGFPDWRQPRRLRPALRLPLAAASLQIARRYATADPVRAVRLARDALRRAPLLIPVFERCYLPVRPPLAGNPVFLVDESRITCCGVDLADFFRRLSLSPSSFPVPILRRQLSAAEKPPLPPPPPTDSRRSLDSIAGKTPRWIEFWSDAAASDRRRRSPSALSDPELFLEIRVKRLPDWVSSYLDRVGAVLREGGWGEAEVAEMVEVAGAAGYLDGRREAAMVDGQAIMDALLLKADRCSDSLRRAGWSSEEVSDVLGFDLRPERRRRPPLKLPPGIAVKIGKLAEAVTRS